MDSQYLRRKLFWLSSGMLIAAVVSITFVTIIPLYKSLYQAESERLGFQVSVQIQRISQEIQRSLDVANQVASRTQARRILAKLQDGILSYESARDRLSDILIDAKRQDRAILAIARYDSSANVIANVGLELPRSILALDQKNFQSVVGPLEVSGKKVILISTLVKDSLDKTLGIDFIAMDLSRILAILGSTDVLYYKNQDKWQLFLSGAKGFDLAPSSYEDFDIPTIGEMDRDIQEQEKHVFWSESVLLDTEVEWVVGRYIVKEHFYESIWYVLGYITLGIALIVMAIILIYAYGIAPVIQNLASYDDLKKANQDLELANENLRKSENRALEASKYKSQFLARMSHDIRTPLNAVLGALEVLKDTTLNTSQMKCLDTAETSGSFLLELVNDILDMDRIESGDLSLEKQSFYLKDFCSKCLEIVRGNIKGKAIRLHLEITPQASSINLLGDAFRLRQVVINLLSNAIKFTDSGTVTLQSDYRSDKLLMKVIDTGKGIRQKDLEKIFDEYSQEDNLASSEAGGYGLGLYICKRLMHAMRGSISVTSELGQGSCFQIEVPLKSEPVEQVFIKNKVESPLPEDLEVKVLVAEDVEANRMLISAFLRDTAIECFFAANGKEALDLFERERFDLILMDVSMPVMPGDVATKKIRFLEQQKSLEPTPIIALTAHTFADTRELMQKAGCDDYLTKPIKRKVLLETIGRYKSMINKSKKTSA